MGDAYTESFSILKWLVLTGVAGFVLRMLYLFFGKDRLTSGIAPSLNTADPASFYHRLLATLGMGRAVRQTLDSYRLPASVGLKIFAWGLAGLVFWYAARMNAMGPEMNSGAVMMFGLLILTTYIALHATFYEIRFDRDTITLPTWWFTHRTFDWRDFEGMVNHGSWMMIFLFRGNREVRVHKYVVGYPLLVEAARKATREV